MYSSLSAAEAERRRETRRDCVQPAIGSSLAVVTCAASMPILESVPLLDMVVPTSIALSNRPPSWRGREPIDSTAYHAMFVDVCPAEVGIRIVSELCQIPPQTPVTHRDLQGHSDAHRCSEKSLMESALVCVGVGY
jgi:hypothetical protein